MSHSRIIQLNNNQTITVTKHNLTQHIEVSLQDEFYFKEKIYHVFICKEEIKAISILFERNELDNIDKFFDFISDLFSNPNKDKFYELHILNKPEFNCHFFIGIRNKYPYNTFSYIREKYKFKLKQKKF